MADHIDGHIARRIRVVILDVDGVLTDNGVYLGTGQGGERIELKRFHIMDGLGIKMLQWAGLRVVMVSGRESAATTLRAEELGVECRQAPAGYKYTLATAVLAESGADWAELAVLGDDLPDLAILCRAGLPVAVANAAAEVRAEATFVTERAGGVGAVREFAEALLQARGQWARLVAAYQQSREEGREVQDYVDWD